MLSTKPTTSSSHVTAPITIKVAVTGSPLIRN